MRIGFSSQVCPDWDFQTMVSRAADLGFDGIEVRVDGDSPAGRELKDRPDNARKLLLDAGVQLVCLGTSATVDSCSRRELARHEAAIKACIELASTLGCPYVRLPAGEVQAVDNHPAALSRIAVALRSLIPAALSHDVTLLVENSRGLPTSHDTWFLVDVVDHPACRCCWNQALALTVRERATTSIPLLGGKIGMLHVCDAEFDEQGSFLGYQRVGQGHTEIARQVEFLKGLTYDGYLVLDWPKERVPSLPPPEDALPEAAKFLRECLDVERPVLTAYKGDKRPAKFVSRPGCACGSEAQ